MSATLPALAAALDAVDEETYVRRADGSQVAQSSSPKIIADLIDRLDIHPGMAVLEVGTGSGYSTALLAHLAGPRGRVVSLDVVTSLVDRARQVLHADGYTNTTVLCGDGANGSPEHGPFDRIIAWATAPHLPAAWVTQLTVDGVIVAPLALAPVSKSGVGIRIQLADDITPYITQLFSAGFVEMHGQELDQWLIPPYGADVLRHDGQNRPWWLSGTWLRNPEDYRQGQRLLETLTTQHHETAGPLEPGESAADFRAWLLAARPDGLTTAALGDPTWRIGHAGPTGAAFTDTHTSRTTIICGKSDAGRNLTTWASTWRRAGRPRLCDLQGHLTPFHDGWTLGATTM